ncbi:hypothetical protein RRG08_061023 [Elysia crispata]|uniref:Uncharacterized protein n=1 Tax=Elysia crispata TaxID=231223 RepID=A0AAE1E4R8_9GAST|nr:hypothetical protein RRG08_061023 [Elysia crispata]
MLAILQLSRAETLNVTQSVYSHTLYLKRQLARQKILAQSPEDACSVRKHDQAAREKSIRATLHTLHHCGDSPSEPLARLSRFTVDRVYGRFGPGGCDGVHKASWYEQPIYHSNPTITRYSSITIMDTAEPITGTFTPVNLPQKCKVFGLARPFIKFARNVLTSQSVPQPLSTSSHVTTNQQTPQKSLHIMRCYSTPGLASAEQGNSDSEEAWNNLERSTGLWT